MHRSLLISLLLLPLATVSSQASAQIYKTTDEQGNVVFTDTPPPGGGSSEKVELHNINTTPPPADMPALAPSPDKEKEKAVEVATATIISPTQDTTIPMGGGNFSVSAAVSPALGRGQTLQLLIDGEPRGEPQPTGFWDLTNVFRGTHSLTVITVDKDGKTISNSDPVQVHVMRPSINFLN